MAVPAYYQARELARALFRLDRCDYPFADPKVQNIMHAMKELHLSPAMKQRLREYEAGLAHGYADADEGYGVLEQAAPLYREDRAREATDNFVSRECRELEENKP